MKISEKMLLKSVKRPMTNINETMSEHEKLLFMYYYEMLRTWR